MPDLLPAGLEIPVILAEDQISVIPPSGCPRDFLRGKIFRAPDMVEKFVLNPHCVLVTITVCGFIYNNYC